MKKIFLSTLGVLAASAVLVPSLASAYQGDPSVQGPNCDGEQQSVVSEALANGDYSAWVSLMGDRGRIAERITEENFSQFAEAHQLALEGKTDEANAIRAELGLGQGSQNRGGNGNGTGSGNGYGRGNK